MAWIPLPFLLSSIILENMKKHLTNRLPHWRPMSQEYIEQSMVKGSGYSRVKFCLIRYSIYFKRIYAPLSMREICKHTNLHLRSVQIAIKKLEEEKFIEKIHLTAQKIHYQIIDPECLKMLSFT